MEKFFREISKFVEKPIHEVLTIQELHRLFEHHGMDLLGDALAGGWGVDDDGRIVAKA
jgi:hypothetical protein